MRFCTNLCKIQKQKEHGREKRNTRDGPQCLMKRVITVYPIQILATLLPEFVNALTNLERQDRFKGRVEK